MFSQQLLPSLDSLYCLEQWDSFPKKLPLFGKNAVMPGSAFLWLPLGNPRGKHIEKQEYFPFPFQTPRPIQDFPVISSLCCGISIGGGADLRVDAMWTKQENAEIKPAPRLRDEFEDLLQESLTDLRPLRVKPRLVQLLHEEPITKIAC